MAQNKEKTSEPFKIGDAVTTTFFSSLQNKRKDRMIVQSMEWVGSSSQTGWMITCKSPKNFPLCADSAWFKKEHQGFFGVEKNKRL